MVFQHMALMPHRSVRDNVALSVGNPQSVEVQTLGGIRSDHALGLVD